MLKISSSGTSNPGKKKINEDNFYMNGIYVAEGNAANGAVYSDNNRRRIQFYAVFDGIGEDVKSDINTNMNFYDGQTASFIAADMLAILQRHLKTKQEYVLDDYILRYIKKTNKSICDYMRQKSIRTGASFALLCFDKNTICAYNVGNSKIFILRDNRIMLLSQNDTKVESLIMAKQVSADIARYTPDNKILTQHLGIFDDEKNISVHINDKLTLRNGDKFLVCSDGLCDYLTNERIYQILSRDISETEIVRDLISEATQSGGRDNLTIIVVGVNYTDDSVKKDILRPTSNVPTNFSPLPYRNSFMVRPKHLKQIAIFGGGALLFIFAIVVIFNGPLKFLAGGNNAGITKSSTSQTSDSVTSATSASTNTNNFIIPTDSSDVTTDINSITATVPDIIDNTDNTDNSTIRQTTPEQTTQKATDAPAVTKPPATSPPATAAPTTQAPTAAPDTTAAVTDTTEAETITAEQTSESEIQSSETVVSANEITEETMETIESSMQTETVSEEVITEPPVTEPPTSPPETDAPPTIQEETIGAEDQGDVVQEES